MRIFNVDNESYLHALAVSIGKDPASLESWRCVHLHTSEGEEISPYMAEKIKELHPNVDCDMIFCPDGDVLMISRDACAAELQGIASALTMGLEKSPEMSVHDLFHDWRTVRALLLSKITSDDQRSRKNPTADESFGEVSSLQEAFEEAKKLRFSRHPQYVMVVDDDPLTRRLVASAFKEKYALITAADAQEAVVNYLLHAPDIVFLDINMPGIGGFAVLHQLIESDPDAYIVMLSGNGYLDNVTAALSEGASGFVAKPFRKDKLRHYIEDSAMHHHKYA